MAIVWIAVRRFTVHGPPCTREADVRKERIQCNALLEIKALASAQKKDELLGWDGGSRNIPSEGAGMQGRGARTCRARERDEQ